MEEFKKKSAGEIADKEIIFSKSIRAGKRIYYLDVKKNRKEEMFLAITESKKVITGEGDHSQVSFEKHKIFLYKEDFEKFLTGLQQSINFIKENDQTALPVDMQEDVEVLEEDLESVSELVLDEEIKIDIDFE